LKFIKRKVSPPPRNRRPPHDESPLDVRTPFLELLTLKRALSGGSSITGGGKGT